MRLKNLRIQGFKSFADRTSLDFKEGVTAIVGSNGCGKSNIADSIRWVLGEQRASAMRGVKMEEVIFQGTARRRPLNFAEVSLLFDNESGRVAVPQSELEVTRKVFREGGSEYSLNRTSCRLRDIQSLLRDTGLGSNAYAIIEAGLIETLLSDRAEERRALFEEAAGIGKYKDSRHAATRKLEAAEADLTRLDDLIAEVESKVRSLARQKRRAERHRELLARRLDLEIAVASAELSRLEVELEIAASERSRLDEEERIAAAERSGAEVGLEERRIEASDLGRQRTARSASLEAVRTKLHEIERQAILSDERRIQSELRMKQLVDERLEVVSRLGELERSASEMASERSQQASALEAVRVVAAARSEEAATLRRALAEERAATEALSARARAIAREIATAEGERSSAERAAREALERRATLAADRDRIGNELSQMTGQTELWESQADEIRARLDAATETVAALREEVSVLKGRAQRALEEYRAADDRYSTLSAQEEAREALERGYEGFAPAVAAVMASRDAFPGVHGPLADYVSRAEEGVPARAVELYLGPLLQALVVEDLATARAIRRWFREEWDEGGSLVLLPGVGDRTGSPSSPPGRRTGEEWARMLLADLQLVTGDPLEKFVHGVARVGPGGEVVDARGMVRLHEVGEAQGILARREALARLKNEVREVSRQREARLRARDALRTALAEAELRLSDAEEARSVVEAQLKGIQLDAAAHENRHVRLQEERERLETELEAAEAGHERATQQLREVEVRLEALAQGVEESAREEATARGRLESLESRWDAAREAEAEARVELARVESEDREGERRSLTISGSRRAASDRLAQIDLEATATRARLEEFSGRREEAAGELDALFSERDRETAALALLDARLAEVDSELVELGERARSARRRETEAAEGRHQVELRIADCRSRIERVRDRIEAEWGRPWSALTSEVSPPEGDPDRWRGELRSIAEQLESLGPVNMLAVEEHAEEDRRLEFLLGQRADLVTARDNLVAAIRQINRTAREVFLSTFETVRSNFQRTFESLFHGGQCNIWLSDPDDPLDSAVEIQASPLGKKTQRIHLLSGGERTLTALALLFALYLVKPSPFCVLDEVDAPLDESNVGRFIQLLEDFKQETQFIVITHNPRTMEAADWVYGVTMEDPGVSSIVGVELLGAWRSEEPVRTTAV